MQQNRLQLGFSMGSFNSTIRFDGDRDVDVEMNTLTFSGAWRMGGKWLLRAGLGAILDGELKADGAEMHDGSPGGFGSVGLEYFAQAGDGFTPFINYTAAIGASLTETMHPVTGNKSSYFATDLRLGVQAGWNIKNRVFPFLSARVFGGPVSWELDGADVTGSDIHHYQLALGTALQFGRVNVFMEWAGLGEKALSAGLSMSL